MRLLDRLVADKYETGGLTEIGFYHLTRSTLEEALPRLLEKAYAAGNRVLVRVGDAERLELLNRALWTYGKDSFLPHGTRADGFPEDQPIYLTTAGREPERGHHPGPGRRRAGPATSPPSTAASTCSTAATPTAVRRRPRALARGARQGHELHLLAAERARRLGQGAPS